MVQPTEKQKAQHALTVLYEAAYKPYDVSAEDIYKARQTLDGFLDHPLTNTALHHRSAFADSAASEVIQVRYRGTMFCVGQKVRAPYNTSVLDGYIKGFYSPDTVTIDFDSISLRTISMDDLLSYNPSITE